jgi:SAM-dependent methyltransferase
MCDLGDLFNTYGSDKDRNGYTPVYDSLFKHIRTDDIALLEIGIGTMIPGVQSSMVGYALPGYAPGGSLRAWRDYFVKGQIVGIDIQPDTQFTDDRITTALANSSDKSALDAVLGDKTFDIIIDDGLHWDETQMATLRNLWDRVRPGGFYIIEDITEWSRIPTEFRSQIPVIVGQSPFFFTEKKNILVISKV